MGTISSLTNWITFWLEWVVFFGKRGYEVIESNFGSILKSLKSVHIPYIDYQKHVT